ncbi:DNA-binding protein [Candidatus Woesearchaeota archaeon]|jgi:putative nucleotide binding protein|nr:DNA-binding protein [Candidatus Woesearchaeota archaeon]|tara:strand:- start:599 stop:1156 length:558 start_codon:yes stop_codon:yes gene_type:complete
MYRKKEEEAIVLDFLPNGYLFDKRPSHMKTPIVQALGKENFTILELVPKKGVFLQPLEEVYIGDEKRDKIHHINGKIYYNKLTQTAKAEIELITKDMIHSHEKRFVEFFNKAQPLSTRMHVIELLPGVGKKHMWEIVEKRQEDPFKSFADIKKRVKLMPDPEKIIQKRIIQELSGGEKHLLFVDK